MAKTTRKSARSKAKTKTKPSTTARKTAKAKSQKAKTNVVKAKQPAAQLPKSAVAKRSFLASVFYGLPLGRPSIIRLKRWYVYGALTLLLLSSIFWSLLGAWLHKENADQLIDPYLFANWNTFHQAVFPGAHTFLLKWPIFAALGLTGASQAALVMATVAVSVGTVGALAYVVARIEKRPLMLGTLYLTLASVLLLVPALARAGALLPINMAMLTTRNLEYVVYMFVIVLFIRSSKQLQSRSLWAATIMLTLLGMSDKLFAVVALGGGVLGLGAYVLSRRWVLARVMVVWLSISVIAYAAAAVGLWLIDRSGLTHISMSESPFGLVHDFKELSRGLAFGVLGILTNLGAHPAFDGGTVREVIDYSRSRLTSLAVLAFVTNAIVAITGLVAASRLWLRSLRRSPEPLDTPTQLSLLLVWSSLASLAVFVLTDHYHAVDARYLSIVFFAVTVSATTWVRARRSMSQKRLVPIALLLALSMVSGVLFALQTYHADKAALSDMRARNSYVAHALASHPVNLLIGDYWRVTPVRSMSSVGILPLQDCTKLQDALSSYEWRKDLTKHSFAYLLTLEGSSTGFPACTLDAVISAYGRPNASTVVSGSLDNPREMLLFYDKGAHRGPPAQTDVSHTTSTVLPIRPQQLPDLTCPSGRTVMNIVAHQDDDLLFLNPDLSHSLREKECVRTVYVTAGDAGEDHLYWLARERGSEAAYSFLLGKDTVWVQRVVKLGDHQFATVTNPRGNLSASLIFLHLPDGNLNGHGFKLSHHESLARLEDGAITDTRSVDGQSVYTDARLVEALTQLMELYQPTEVRTQTTYNMSELYADHSDHMAVGRYAQRAFSQYSHRDAAHIAYYIGYPIREMAGNVADEDLMKKMKAFVLYARFDNSVCRSVEQCDRTPTYGSYLRRQYRSE